MSFLSSVVRLYMRTDAHLCWKVLLGRVVGLFVAWKLRLWRWYVGQTCSVQHTL